MNKYLFREIKRAAEGGLDITISGEAIKSVLAEIASQREALAVIASLPPPNPAKEIAAKALCAQESAMPLRADRQDLA